MTDVATIFPRPELVSVILPTYNEKTNAVLLVDAIHRELVSYRHEIIIADDNSPDGTYAAIVALGDERVRAILRTADRGFAKSIRCGMERARGDAVIIMDSDFNHQPEYLPRMIDALSHYECVTASRFLYGGRMDHPVRHILSWLFNLFVRLMTGGKITDSLYGFLAIRRSALDRVDFDNVFWGYGDYCIRLMYYLQREAVSILQIPAINGQRRAGTGNTRFFRIFWQYFTAVLALTYRIRVANGGRK